MSSITKEYQASVISRMKYYKELGDNTFGQLTDLDFHYQPNAASNSIALIIQHMHGNMLSRWTNFLKEDGEKEWRHRDEEFIVHDYTKYQLLQLWETGWECFFNALQSIKKKDFSKTIYIRDEPLSVLEAINRQLAHYAYHIGQIVYLGKMIKIEAWKSLSIPKGGSNAYNISHFIKDPAKKFS